MAFTTTSNVRGRGAENDAEIAYLVLALDICIKYFSAAIVDMAKLIPQCVPKLHPEKLKIVSDKFLSYAT